MDCLTPTGRIRNELNSHPALLDCIKSLLEENFDCNITYRITRMGGTTDSQGNYKEFTWTERPKIQPKGGETT